MVKLMIVPYISKPPMIDMTIAGYWISAQWASNVGRAKVASS